VVLEDLQIQRASTMVRGIVLQEVTVSPSEDPLVVEKCTIEAGNMCDAAIFVAGPVGQGELVPTSGGIAVRGNRVEEAARGIHMQGALANTHVTGNLVCNCWQQGIGIEDLPAGAAGVLIANNTVFSSGSAFRVWDDPPYEQFGQVEFRNNLLVEASDGDFLFVRGANAPDRTQGVFPVDGSFLYDLWRFDHNWRDLSGAEAYVRTPLAPGDKKLDKIDLLSRNPSSPDFLRPAEDSPLATQGAGNEDPTLPKYVGALPPEGVEPWDWDKTWQSRAATPPDDP
jgi:hypothetical protein